MTNKKVTVTSTRLPINETFKVIPSQIFYNLLRHIKSVNSRRVGYSTVSESDGVLSIDNWWGLLWRQYTTEDPESFLVRFYKSSIIWLLKHEISWTLSTCPIYPILMWNLCMFNVRFLEIVSKKKNFKLSPYNIRWYNLVEYY